MRVGDYGFTIRIDTDFDLSGTTLLELNIEFPDSSTTTYTMTLGTTSITIGSLGAFLANEYAEYIAQVDDFNQSGTYTISLSATWGTTKKFKTPDGTFEIES